MNSNLFRNTCKNLCKKLVNLEDTDCCVCLDKINNGVLILPCNHYQVCFKCCASLQNCPICREKIVHVVNYFSDDKHEKLFYQL
tara:strand:- start:216 stop:467 length:252 start_codon:yes stop_codon:yes gene_type:complete